MNRTRTFLMGRYEAPFPDDRHYCDNHMWARDGDAGLRFGFTAYAVRLLQDVYFLDWYVDPGARLQHRQAIGSIESKKAESELYAPVAGELVRFNTALLEDPSAINVDTYGAGWLFEMKPRQASLMDVDQYLEHLERVWEVTQRTIKGQMNQ